MSRTFLIGWALLASGCGTSTSVEGGTDATTDSASNTDSASSDDGAAQERTTDDASTDADGADGGHDATGDGDALTGDAATAGGDATSGADARTGDAASAMDGGGSDVLTVDGACACQPYWCGCGPCNAGQIACTVGHAACARGCLSSCPELQQVTCGCDQGRCVRSGVDASVACFTDQDCPVGDCCSHVGSSAQDIASGTCTTAPNTCCGAGCP